MAAGSTGVVRQIDRALERALSWSMALLLFAMMAVTTIDVLGRYFFSAPIPGGYEMVQFMMALVVFCSLPITTRQDSHLTVSLISGNLKGGAARAHRLVVLLLSLAGTIVIAWRMWGQGAILTQSKQVSNLLEWPLGPIAYAMSVFAWLTVAILLAMIVAAVRGRDAGPTAPPRAID